jgi:amino acid/peptide:H+ symporter
MTTAFNLDFYVPVAAAIAVVLAWIAFVYWANRRIHPPVLFRLFLVELWERFSYYGMRAFLMLYLTKGLLLGGFGLEEDTGYGIYAAWGALVYLTPILGGLLADRFLGFRKAIIWGAILMASGQFILAGSSFANRPEPAAWQAEIDKRRADAKDPAAAAERKAKEQAAEAAKAKAERETGEPKKKEPAPRAPINGRTMLMFAGLAFITIGNGFFKPNISSMIGRFYAPGDSRRDGAFTIFYMGINIGAFLAPLACGTVAETEGWGWGFLMAGVGMLVGLLLFLQTVKSGLLERHADPPAAPPGGHRLFNLPAESTIYLGTFLAVALGCGLIYLNEVMDWLLAGIGLAVVLYMLHLSTTYDKAPRERIWVIVVLVFFTTVFWTFFELAGSAITVFTEKNVSKQLVGVTLTTSNFQAFNAFFIMLFAPIFSAMWIWLARANKEPPAPLKFSAGLALLGLGFIVLNAGRSSAEANNGMMPATFLVALYLLHTLGELALSPVGLSLVTKLAPERVVGFMMGFWFLSSAIAHQAGAFISKMTTTVDKYAPPVETLAASLNVFNGVGYTALGSAAVLLVLSPLLTKWMHGVK